LKIEKEMTISFTYTELTEFFRELKRHDRIEKHLLRTIAATRKAGLYKLEAMVQQEAIKMELFEKIKLAVENPQFKIIIQ
jgi:chemotaxis methyl-accepting protein methylase